VVSVNLLGCARRTCGTGYAWKTIGCDEVSIFLAGDLHPAPCAGAGRKACPTPAHPGCRPYCYSRPAYRPYPYSIPVGAASTAASPCVDVNIGHSRTHRTEEDTGSDRRLISSVRFDEAKKPADIGKDDKNKPGKGSGVRKSPSSINADLDGAPCRLPRWGRDRNPDEVRSARTRRLICFKARPALLQ
jgi:hypothetical protein